VPATIEIDRACAEAVDLARDAALRRSGVFGVSDYLGASADGVRMVTHYFGCPHPGYPGWRWSVTVVRASRARVVTVNEVTLVPGDGALLPPAWIPWSARIEPGDIVPGALLPVSPEDPRLVPGYTGGEDAVDADPAEWAQTRALVAELGLGRERLLSPRGRDEAADRWIGGVGGPGNPMTAQAPALCHTCGFFVALSGTMGRVFGVCANEYSPTDARIVSRDHGCGGHSDVRTRDHGADAGTPLWDTVSIDSAIFD